jgi:SAM-dependent methyltransferase
MVGFDQVEVSERYNSIPTIWDVNDKWHSRTHDMIKSFITTSVMSIPQEQRAKTLNAGSAGYSYDLGETGMCHLDLAKTKISSLSNAVLGNVQKMPFKSSTFGLIVCVGSVINYCDPVRVFEEFKRLLITKGYLILEFESSRTLELLGKPSFNNSVVLTDTFYNGTKERLWYFSERFVQQLALEFEFEICARDTCHVISPLVYRMIRSESFASRFAFLDGFRHRIPGINLFASNVIYLFRNKS